MRIRKQRTVNYETETWRPIWYERVAKNNPPKIRKKETGTHQVKEKETDVNTLMQHTSKTRRGSQNSQWIRLKK